MIEIEKYKHFLSERELLVLRERFINKKTFKTIGDNLGIGKARTAQVIKNAQYEISRYEKYGLWAVSLNKTRLCNALLKAGFRSEKSMLDLYRKDPDMKALLTIKSIKQKSVDLIKKTMKEIYD